MGGLATEGGDLRTCISEISEGCAFSGRDGARAALLNRTVAEGRQVEGMQQRAGFRHPICAGLSALDHAARFAVQAAAARVRPSRLSRASQRRSSSPRAGRR